MMRQQKLLVLDHLLDNIERDLTEIQDRLSDD